MHGGAEQALGVHEGPQQQGLAADADPYGAALVPAPGAAQPSAAVLACKSAAVLASIEYYMESLGPLSFQVLPHLIEPFIGSSRWS